MTLNPEQIKAVAQALAYLLGVGDKPNAQEMLLINEFYLKTQGPHMGLQTRIKDAGPF